MFRLKDSNPGASIQGVVPDCMVVDVSVQWDITIANDLMCHTASGHTRVQSTPRSGGARPKIVIEGQTRSCDTRGALVPEVPHTFLVHLSVPLLTVHTSRLCRGPVRLLRAAQAFCCTKYRVFSKGTVVTGSWFQFMSTIYEYRYASA